MKILALDTSGTSHSVALLLEDQVLICKNLSEVSAHTEVILPTLQNLLTAAQWKLEQLDLLALTVGPGSFTGLRIGMSAIKAIAWAKRKSVVGIDTLQALAAPHWHYGQPVLSCMDARRGEVYASLTRRESPGPVEILSPPRLWSWQALKNFLDDFPAPLCAVGSGITVYPQILSDLPGATVISELHFQQVQAPWVGRLAWDLAQIGNVQTSQSIRPLYLRVSHAEAMRAQGGI